MRALLDGYDALARSDGGLPTGLRASFVTSRPERVVQAVWQPAGFDRRVSKMPAVETVIRSDPTHVALAWGGNQMNLRALVSIGRPFDFLLPSSVHPPQLEPGVELIPCAVVDAVMRQRLEGNDTLLQLIDDCARRDVRVTLLIPHPPLPEWAVRQRLANEPHFATVLETMRTDPSSVPIVPDPVRARLWTLMAGAYRAFADRHGLDRIDPPNESIDSETMLASPYFGTSATHANAAYGELVLGHIFDWAQTLPVGAGDGEELP